MFSPPLRDPSNVCLCSSLSHNDVLMTFQSLRTHVALNIHTNMMADMFQISTRLSPESKITARQETASATCNYAVKLGRSAIYLVRITCVVTQLAPATCFACSCKKSPWRHLTTTRAAVRLLGFLWNSAAMVAVFLRIVIFFFFFFFFFLNYPW